MSAMTPRDHERLRGVHPQLTKAVVTILEAMHLVGHPMFVVSGVRTDADQAKLYAQGRTAPGPIVTMLDGRAKRSNHQTNIHTGFGHAVDCAFVDMPDTPFNDTWDDRSPWELYGVLAETFGLSWGGRWTRPVDKPHIELRVWTDERRA